MLRNHCLLIVSIFSVIFFLLNIFDDPNKKLAIPESSGWIFRDVAGASLSPLVEAGRRVATANGERDAPATSRKIHPDLRKAGFVGCMEGIIQQQPLSSLSISLPLSGCL